MSESAVRRVSATLHYKRVHQDGTAGLLWTYTVRGELEPRQYVERVSAERAAYWEVGHTYTIKLND